MHLFEVARVADLESTHRSQMGVLQHLGAGALTPQLHQETLPHFAQEVGQLSFSSPRLQCCRRRSNSASFENLRMRLSTSYECVQREWGGVVVRAANRVFRRTRPERRPSVSVIIRNLSSNGANPVQVCGKQILHYIHPLSRAQKVSSVGFSCVRVRVFGFKVYGHVYQKKRERGAYRERGNLMSKACVLF